MEVYLAPVKPEERDVLYRLLQYSLYEESAFDGNEMDETARFAYPWFDAYWTSPDWEAYLIRSHEGGRLLGFVMVNSSPRKVPSGHSAAEFMVLPPYRRKGVGRAAALACFRTHPGTWEVSPSLGSEGAYRFWERVIEDYTGSPPRFEDGVFIFSAISR